MFTRMRRWQVEQEDRDREHNTLSPTHFHYHEVPRISLMPLPAALISPCYVLVRDRIVWRRNLAANDGHRVAVGGADAEAFASVSRGWVVDQGE